MIQPLGLDRLPCYACTPILSPTLGHALLALGLWTLGVRDSHGVTGGVYKARERIHRGMLIRVYWHVLPHARVWQAAVRSRVGL